VIARGTPSRGPDSPLLAETVRLATPVILVTSLYLLFAGHNAPGGGFIGGLVAAAAVFLRYVSAGPDARGLTRLPSEVLLGVGLLCSLAAGLSSVLVGDTFLEAWTFEEDLAVLGTVKFTSSLPFDIGVYLVVLGLAVAVVDSLGREGDL
jgi:multisubunit Na+/H+ antiporter MnhB subunit